MMIEKCSTEFDKVPTMVNYSYRLWRKWDANKPVHEALVEILERNEVLSEMRIEAWVKSVKI